VVRVPFNVEDKVTFDEWLKTAPLEFTQDPLWKMEAYRLAFLASDLSWLDVTKLMHDKRTLGLSDQLYRAVGSIKANIAEGYSHRSGKDQARFYEYSLGSAREARGWYHDARHVLGEPIALHRTRLMTKNNSLIACDDPCGTRLQTQGRASRLYRQRANSFR